jgi:PadR family transcriptional regulator, regulatory protein PadR
MATRKNKPETEEINQPAETPESKAEATNLEDETKTAKSSRSKAAKSGQSGQEEGEFSLAPKTFLTPYILLMLRDTLLHGYAIWEKLMIMGIPGLNESDRATIYRTLRQLEKEGKIKSEWETPTGGPARRVYSLTGTGDDFLRMWAMGLDQYRQSLDFFFKLYSGGLNNPFFGFPYNKEKEKGKRRED